jgi:hypothetical protein
MQEPPQLAFQIGSRPHFDNQRLTERRLARAELQSIFAPYMTSAFSKPARSSSRRLSIISGVSGRGAFEFEARITALHRDDQCTNSRNDK